MLHLIQNFLEKQQFDCIFIEATPEIPIDRLVVTLGQDSKQRSFILAVQAAQIEIPKEFATENADQLPFRLQFSVALPFTIDDLALNQVASLILFINQYVDLPGFELNELNGIASYRYIWLTKKASCDFTLVVSIIGSILLNLNLFSDMIELLADGKVTFNDLLEKVLKAVNESSQGDQNI